MQVQSVPAVLSLWPYLVFALDNSQFIQIQGDLIIYSSLIIIMIIIIIIIFS